MVKVKKKEKNTSSSKDCRPRTCEPIMNYTQTTKENQTKFIEKQNLGHLENNSDEMALLFSYSIIPDAVKKRDVQFYIDYVKSKYSDLVLKKYNSTNEYVNNIFIKSSSTGQINQLNHKSVQEYKIKDDINYKNSYVKYAYETIPNPSPIFITNTLKSDYHPFVKNGKEVNPILKKSGDFREAFDKMIFDGYSKLEEAREAFYKNRLFKSGSLTKDKRALILAVEPHKTFVPHTHKLEVIEGSYLKEYISKTIDNCRNYDLGRTEIAIFERDWDSVKNDYVLTFKDGLYFLDDYIYFRVLEQRSDTEIQSILNYMTKYIEQSYIIDDEEKDKKKSSVVYSAFAYYVASLKDKFVPKLDGKKHKKIRRIRYARLLISKEVYRSIMTKELIEYLKEIGKHHKQNMYLHITKLLNSKELEIYRYYKIDADTGRILRDKIYYYKVVIGDFSQIIDEMLNEVYKYECINGQKVEKSLYKYEKIDLEINSHFIDRYNEKDGDECIIIDKDVIVGMRW